MKKIYIIAGEASGDALGAKLIKSLQKLSSTSLEFHGIGGQRMCDAGFNSLFPMSEISLMGFAEIVPHIPNLINRINQTVENITNINPDIIITIDSPGFNFRVAGRLQGLGIKMVHYVAPTVWAYKPERAAKVAALYDHLLVILPFEPPYFTKEGLDTTYIGHPIIEDFTDTPDSTKFRRDHNISTETKLLCVMPGSRITEIKRLLPVFIETIKHIAEKVDKLELVIPTIPSLEGIIQESFKNLPYKSYITTDIKEKFTAFSACNAALAKSGTGTLELSMAGVPMVIAYKISPISHWFISRIIQIKYANLLNITEEREIIPEFIQENCTADNMSERLIELLSNEHIRSKQLINAGKALEKLGKDSGIIPSDKAANVILGMMS